MSNYLSFEEYAEKTGITLSQLEDQIRKGEVRFSIDTDGSKSIFYERPESEHIRVKTRSFALTNKAEWAGWARETAVWGLAPITLIMILVDIGLNHLALLGVVYLLTGYSLDQAIERRRSPRLAVVARSLGMRFDGNLSWFPFDNPQPKYDCFLKTSVPLLKRSSGFKNIFVLNDEPAVFGCRSWSDYRPGAQSQRIFLTVYRFKGEIPKLKSAAVATNEWNIEVGDGFTVYYKDDYSTAIEKIRDQYLECQKLHQQLVV